MTSLVLNRPTLVLNRSWQPLGVNTVARALVKVWNDTARVVDPTDYQLYSWEDWSELRADGAEDVIRTANMTLRIPEVIVLTRYNRLPKRKVAFTRRNLFRRDNFTCQYCGNQQRGDQLTIDHVLPRSRGGQSTWSNCVLACSDCNSRKADRTPNEAGMPLLAEPVRPRWKPEYSAKDIRVDSWSKFISEAYWSVELSK